MIFYSALESAPTTRKRKITVESESLDDTDKVLEEIKRSQAGHNDDNFEITKSPNQLNRFDGLQLEDENASKYFINYINEEAEDTIDSAAEPRPTHRTDEDRDLDLSELPSSLIITSVPQELFTNQEMKVSLVVPSPSRTLRFVSCLERIRTIVSCT